MHISHPFPLLGPKSGPLDTFYERRPNGIGVSVKTLRQLCGNLSALHGSGSSSELRDLGSLELCLRIMSEKDPFKDLSFSGAPSEYRLFRRKILLSVASLEEKHVYLAGPRILNRLTGEAWRATEHLSHWRAAVRERMAQCPEGAR